MKVFIFDRNINLTINTLISVIENIYFMKYLITQYMGSCLQPNGLIWLSQVCGYVLYSMDILFKGKRKD